MLDTALVESDGEVLTEYVSMTGPSGSIMEGTCPVLLDGEIHATLTFRVYGSGAGETTGNIDAIGTIGATEFAAHRGQQAFTVELITPVHEVAPAGATFTGATTFESPLEING